MYIVLRPGVIVDAFLANTRLFAQFVRQEPGAHEVLVDLLLEHAIWSTTSWPDARLRLSVLNRKQLTRENLFWVGNGRVRQRVGKRLPDNIRRVTKDGRLAIRYGWQEIEVIRRLRAAEKRRKKEDS